LLQRGTIVAGYRVDGVLGEGGMGVVYRATQLSLNRVIALKLLAGELSDDPGFRARFQREGQLQAGLDHDHIVSVYEAGQTEHGLFLAMRLVDGPTLKDLILRGELEPRRSLRLLAQVAQALDAAHETGLIHRDIKPQNILIGKGDQAYLADFGLIKAPDDADRLTGTGQFMGTIDYVAPEQIQGEPASAASDTYALAGVLYECLTGQVPFPRANEAATLHAQITAPPPGVTEQRPELPAALDEVIAAGLAKVPAARPSSATELVRMASRAFASGSPQVASPAQPTRLTPSPGDGERSQATRVPAAGVAAATAASPGLAARPAEMTREAQSPATAPAARADAVGHDAAAAPAPARRAAGSRGAPLAIAGLLALAAVAAGFLIGHSGSKTTSSGFTNLATVGHLQLRYPPDVQLSSALPATPGLSLSDPVSLSRSSVGGVAAGMAADAGGPTLLPTSFRSRLQGALPTAATVSLGGLQAYRYSGLQVRGAPGAVTVYAVPTTAGVATIVCSAASAATGARWQPECDQVAATLRLVGTTAYPLGVSPAYARALSSAFDRLRTSTSGPLAALRGAGSPSGQATAAEQLAAAYARAATQLGGVALSPILRDSQRSILAALTKIGAGYSRVAAAARAGAGDAYTRAGQDVSSGSSALSRALQTLASLGYAVGHP
jgi:predicted Ser/Thr protein kinase